MLRWKKSTAPPEHDSSDDIEKHNAQVTEFTDRTIGDSSPEDPSHSLHRGLSARQISMIAIGGAIGTGLIIGTGQALAQSGPGSVFIAYSFVGVIVYAVMCALGEMATWIPAPGGFAIYANRFVDPALGFAVGYTYWFKYIITTPNQLTAAALVIQYWCPPERVNPGVFIAVFLITIIIINYFGVRFFGEFEFWLSSIKVIVMIGLIILSLVIALGGGPNRRRTGFLYWSDPGAFAPYLREGAIGRFIGVWACMVNAVFAYLGTELIGVTVGEAENPRRNVPRAIKLTFWRILVFYILAVLFLGMIVPYNSPELLFANEKKAASNAAASPFVVAIRLAAIPYLDAILNGAILIFVFSASNSDLYIASRTLHGIALKGQAPSIFARTDRRGVPVFALGLSAAICCLAFMSVSAGSQTVFGYFVNLVSIFGLLTWISILVSHIYFIKARNAQGVDPKSMRYRSPFGLWGSYAALAFCCLIALTKNFYVFIPYRTWGNFDYKNFITGYLGIPLYLIMIFGWKFVKKTKQIHPLEADLWSGKDVIDADEVAWIEKEAAKRAAGGRGYYIYRHTIGLLF